jgi:hypothetical protein
MICHDDWVSKEAAEYLNSHPAFQDSNGCIMDPEFFNNYIGEFTDKHKGTVPIADKYRKGVWGQERFTLEDAKEFIKWLDPKWTEYKGLSKSEFFKGPELELANDGIEFMDI